MDDLFYLKYSRGSTTSRSYVNLRVCNDIFFEKFSIMIKVHVVKVKKKALQIFSRNFNKIIGQLTYH